MRPNQLRPGRPAPGVLQRLLLLWLSVGIGLTASCSPIQWYAKQTGKGAVRGFYEGMADIDDQVRHQVTAALLSDPSLRKTAHDLTESIIIGAVDGLSQAKLDKLAGQIVQNTLTTLRAQGDSAMSQLVRDAGPLLDQALHRAVEDAVMTLGTSLRESAQGDLGTATSLLMKSAVEGVLQALNRSGRELARELNENTERYLTEKVAPGAGIVARTVTREAILGMQDGLMQSGMKDQMPALRMVMREVGMGLGEGLGVGFGRSVQKSPLEPILTGITIVLGILFVAAVVGIILIWRRYMSASGSLALFAQEMNQAELTDQERVQALRRSIQQAHTAAKKDAFLDQFLKGRGLYKPISLVGPGEGKRVSPNLAMSQSGTVIAVSPNPGASAGEDQSSANKG